MSTITAKHTLELPHSRLCDLRIKANRIEMPLERLVENLIDAFLVAGNYDVASLQEFVRQILESIKEFKKDIDYDNQLMKNSLKSIEKEIQQVWQYRANSESRLDILERKLETKTSGRGSGRKGIPNPKSVDIDSSLTPDQLIGKEYRLCQWERYLGTSPGQIGTRLSKAKKSGCRGALVRGHLLLHTGPGLAVLEQIIPSLEYGKIDPNTDCEAISGDSES